MRSESLDTLSFVAQAQEVKSNQILDELKGIRVVLGEHSANWVRLNGSLKDTQKDLEELKPMVADHEKLKNRGYGAFAVLAVLWAALEAVFHGFMGRK